MQEVPNEKKAMLETKMDKPGDGGPALGFKGRHREDRTDGWIGSKLERRN